MTDYIEELADFLLTRGIEGANVDVVKDRKEYPLEKFAMDRYGPGGYIGFVVTGPAYPNEPFITPAKAAKAWLRWVTGKKRPTKGDAIGWLARLKIND